MARARRLVSRGDHIVSDLLLLDPAPLPEALGIPVEDWHQTPTSVRQQFLALLKQVDALKTRLHRDSSNSSRPLRRVVTAA
jgi:hypothetical protein